eukprot:CAMPEP_0206606980 /NCGR_PEP_ID=MMETSP0325_2-20121206/51793_1 /ASSEMBLY_ACC=CAM_ASM_000347 /TAXON_ID=2866 /ORGANISM="Crypthecodinium cohnii, Strain Seligo" /LENGTH=821 /DNA_ID=CAMNT_0054123737 /DNA_START=23 /DNA_END=2488 /DNA_ORIENTATION=+
MSSSTSIGFRSDIPPALGASLPAFPRLAATDHCCPGSRVDGRSNKEVDLQCAAYEASVRRGGLAHERLKAWTDYYKWAADRGDSGSTLARDVLERACEDIGEEPSLSDDPRLLRLWVHYADHSDSPSEVLSELYRKRIGRIHTLLFEAWSTCLEKAHRYAEAEEVLLLGLEEFSEPRSRLEGRLEAFQDRMRRRQARRGRGGNMSQSLSSSFATPNKEYLQQQTSNTNTVNTNSSTCSNNSSKPANTSHNRSVTNFTTPLRQQEKHVDSMVENSDLLQQKSQDDYSQQQLQRQHQQRQQQQVQEPPRPQHEDLIIKCSFEEQRADRLQKQKHSQKNEQPWWHEQESHQEREDQRHRQQQRSEHPLQHQQRHQPEVLWSSEPYRDDSNSNAHVESRWEDEDEDQESHDEENQHDGDEADDHDDCDYDEIGNVQGRRANEEDDEGVDEDEGLEPTEEYEYRDTGGKPPYSELPPHQEPAALDPAACCRTKQSEAGRIPEHPDLHDQDKQHPGLEREVALVDDGYQASKEDESYEERRARWWLAKRADTRQALHPRPSQETTVHTEEATGTQEITSAPVRNLVDRTRSLGTRSLVRTSSAASRGSSTSLFEDPTFTMEQQMKACACLFADEGTSTSSSSWVPQRPQSTEGEELPRIYNGGRCLLPRTSSSSSSIPAANIVCPPHSAARSGPSTGTLRGGTGGSSSINNNSSNNNVNSLYTDSGRRAVSQVQGVSKVGTDELRSVSSFHRHGDPYDDDDDDDDDDEDDDGVHEGAVNDKEAYPGFEIFQDDSIEFRTSQTAGGPMCTNKSHGTGLDQRALRPRAL